MFNPFKKKSDVKPAGDEDVVEETEEEKKAASAEKTVVSDNLAIVKINTEIERMNVMCEILEEIDDLYNKKKSKLREVGIFLTNINDISEAVVIEKPKDIIYKRVLLIKIDTTGLDGEAAMSVTHTVKENFKLTEEEEEQFFVIFLPTYEGDLSSVQLLG